MGLLLVPQLHFLCRLASGFCFYRLYMTCCVPGMDIRDPRGGFCDVIMLWWAASLSLSPWKKHTGVCLLRKSSGIHFNLGTLWLECRRTWRFRQRIFCRAAGYDILQVPCPHIHGQCFKCKWLGQLAFDLTHLPCKTTGHCSRWWYYVMSLSLVSLIHQRSRGTILSLLW